MAIGSVIGVLLTIIIGYYIYSYTHRPCNISISTSPTCVDEEKLKEFLAAPPVKFYDVEAQSYTMLEEDEAYKRFIKEVTRQHEDV